MKYIIFTIAIATLLFATITLLDARDKKLMVAAQAYETCIIEEYNQHPTEYYQINGQYPTCHK